MSRFDRKIIADYFDNLFIFSVRFHAKMAENVLKYGDFMIFYIVLYHIKLNVFEFWTDNMRHLKTSPWTLRDWDGHFPVFYTPNN